jgi:hypothetical protein
MPVINPSGGEAGTVMPQSRYFGIHSKVPQAQYFVIQHKGEWRIRAGYRTTGSYPNKAQATCAAIDFAEKDGMAGRQAQVLVQDDDRHFRTAWVYGRDPYPVTQRAS